jgi:FkbM family methyltransferase
MVALSGEALFDRIDATRQLVAELEPILQSLMLNDSAIVDGLAQMLGSLQQMQQRSEERLAQLGADVGELGLLMHDLLKQPATSTVNAAAFDRDDPELSLLEHLLPYLPNPFVLDVGANTGKIAGRLVGAGYEVFAFEPYPPTFSALVLEAQQADMRLHPFPYAIGASDGIAELLVANDRSGTDKWDTSLFHSTLRHPMLEDLTFGAVEIVPTRALASLACEGAIPADAAILKIDTEGADLAVIQGAGTLRFAVVLIEFWDRGHPFGRDGHGDLASIVSEMRQRGYPWHIQIFRVDELHELGYFCNSRTTPFKSWGNAVFFSEFSLFSRAADWCSRCMVKS